MSQAPGRRRYCPGRWGTGVGGASAGEAAGQQVEHQGQAEPLVGLGTSHRQDAAQGRLVEHGRVGRGLALIVQQPAFGNLLLVEVVRADLALGGDAGAEVEDDGVSAAGGHARAQGVRAQAGLDAAGRGDSLAGTTVIDRGDQDQALFGRSFRVFAQPADMAAMPGCAGGDPLPAGLGNDEIQQAVGLDLPQAPLAVGRDDRLRLVINLQVDARLVLPFSRKPRYWGARITPCESCPRRFAPTRLMATSRASAAGTPAASKREEVKSISSFALSVGTSWAPS